MTVAVSSNSSVMFIERLVTTEPLASCQIRFSAPQRLSPKVAPRFQVAIWFPVFLTTIATFPVVPGYRTAAGLASVFWSRVIEYAAMTDTGNSM